VEEPGNEARSDRQEARTCPVCGTKFFATADSGFCPVCILRGAASGESAAIGELGSVTVSALEVGWSSRNRSKAILRADSESEARAII
jgi:hypothetical protein